jgi:hypothetical protein
MEFFCCHRDRLGSALLRHLVVGFGSGESADIAAPDLEVHNWQSGGRQ